MTKTHRISKSDVALSDWAGLNLAIKTNLLATVAADSISRATNGKVRVRGAIGLGVDASQVCNRLGPEYDTVIVNVLCENLKNSTDQGFWLRAHTHKIEHRRAFFESDRRGHAFLIPLSCFKGTTQAILEVDSAGTPVNGKMWKGGDPDLTISLSVAPRKRLELAVAESTIFVFSTARSGSTWLASDILGWRNRTRVVDEPGFGQLFAPLQWDAERFADLSRCMFYIPSGFAYESGGARRDLPTDILPVFERRNAALTGPSAIFNPAHIHNFQRMVRRVVVHHLIDEWGLGDFERFVVKLPNESHAADFLLQAIPEARAIHLVRDGRDVMRSRFGAFSSQILEETRDPALRQYGIAFYSHLWNFQNDIISAACAEHDQAKVIRVRYEDLHFDRLNQSRSILKWIGLDLPKEEEASFLDAIDIANAPAAEVGYGKRRGDGSIGKFRHAFSAADIALMEEIMGPVLERFGYGLSSSDLSDKRSNAADTEVQNLYGTLRELRAELVMRDAQIQELKREVKSRGIWATNLDDELTAKNARIVELQKEVEERNAWALTLDQRLNAQGEEIAQLRRLLNPSAATG